MIGKNVPTRINTDDFELDLKPGEYNDALNVITFSGNTGGLRKSIAVGNTKITAVFPGLGASAKCIGTAHQTLQRRSIVIFYQAPNIRIYLVDHSVSFIDVIVTLLVNSPNYGVDATSYLQGSFFVDDLFYFNFNEASPKVINIQRALSQPGFYDALPEQAMSVIKPRPAYSPLVERAGSGFNVQNASFALTIAPWLGAGWVWAVGDRASFAVSFSNDPNVEPALNTDPYFKAGMVNWLQFTLGGVRGVWGAGGGGVQVALAAGNTFTSQSLYSAHQSYGTITRDKSFLIRIKGNINSTTAQTIQIRLYAVNPTGPAFLGAYTSVNIVCPIGITQIDTLLPCVPFVGAPTPVSIGFDCFSFAGTLGNATVTLTAFSAEKQASTLYQNGINVIPGVRTVQLNTPGQADGYTTLQFYVEAFTGSPSSGVVGEDYLLGTLLLTPGAQAFNVAVNFTTARPNLGFIISYSQPDVVGNGGFGSGNLLIDSAGLVVTGAVDQPIERKQYQFFDTFVYLDGENSVLSPASEFLNAIDDSDTTGILDAINVLIRFQPEVYSVISDVVLLVRNDNDFDAIRTVITLPKSLFSLIAGVYQYLYKFTDQINGTLVARSFALRPFDAVPRLTDYITFLKGRMFLPNTLVDYNIEDTWSLQITMAKSAGIYGDDRSPAGFTVYTQSTFMDDSEYSTCLVFFDKFGRRIPPTKGFVKIITPKFIPKALPGADNPPGTAQGIFKDIASYTIAGPNGTGVGVPPSYAFYWTFSRSKNIKWEFKIMRKCILRFPYSTTPYDGVSAKPANTFVEDGFLYWDFQAINATGSAAARNNMSNDYIDIIVPSNFPFPIDNKVIVDFATQLHSSTAPNAVTILDRDVVALFSNKIRIRGDGRIRWLKTAAQAGPYTTHPKFFSGVNLQASQTLLQDEFAMPIIFKRRASTNLAELIHYDEPNAIAVVNPGGTDRSFGGSTVIQEDVYNTVKGAFVSNYNIPVNGSVLQPFLVAPDTIHSDQRLVVDWATVNTGFAQFSIEIQLWSLNQSTQEPVALLASIGKPAGQGSVEYALSGFPNLSAGWYGYAIKMNPLVVPQFPDQTFTQGLTYWLQGPDNGVADTFFWEPGSTGTEFYVTFSGGAHNVDIPSTGYTRSIYWILNIPFSLISLEVDIETSNVRATPVTTPVALPSTTDGGIQVEFGGNQSAIMPVFITVPAGGSVSIVNLQIDLPNTITNPSQKVYAEIWSLDAVTKKPLSLLAGGPNDTFETAGLKTLAGFTALNINTSKFYGVGFRITGANISAANFSNPSFGSAGAGWVQQDTGVAWTFSSPFAVATGIGGPSYASKHLGQVGLTGVFGITMKIRASANVGINLEIFDSGASANRGSSPQVFLTAGVDTVVTQMVTVTPGSPLSGGAFFRILVNGAPVTISVSEVSVVQSNILKLRGNAASAEKFWFLNGGVWSEDTRGLPWTLNVSSFGYTNPPANILIQPQDKNNAAIGPAVSIAPNIRQVVALTLTSGLPTGGYGVAIKNTNSVGGAVARLFRISTVSVPPATPAIKVYALTNPTYTTWLNGGSGWAISTGVSGFSLKVKDVAITALVAKSIRPDCYAVTQNYLNGEVPGHSDPWGNAPYIAIGFPYPSMASDPDALGITYLEKVVQSIGYPNVKVNNVNESHRGNEIRWSDTVVEGSNTNNLNSFAEENKFVLDFTRGPVRVLLAMHDNTLLAVHEAAMTSLYVEKVILSDAQGTDNLLASTDKVIQAERQLYTNMGTLNPESCIVVESGLIAYGFDLRRMSLWRKSNNGVDNLTIVGKARKLFEQLSIPRIFAFQQGIDVKVYTGYDEYLKALYITFAPVTLNGVTYPAETICWSELVQGFVSRFSFKPDAYLILKGSFYTVKAEGVEPPTLWFHGRTGLYNTFYNVAYTSLMKLVFMDQGDIKKIFNSMAVDSNEPWKVTRIETEEGNISSLDYSNFVLRDGRHYSTLLRDENTDPAALAPGQTARLHGDKLVGKWVKMTIVNEITTEQVVLDAVYLGYDGLSGHLLQNKP